MMANSLRTLNETRTHGGIGVASPQAHLRQMLAAVMFSVTEDCITTRVGWFSNTNLKRVKRNLADPSTFQPECSGFLQGEDD